LLFCPFASLVFQILSIAPGKTAELSGFYSELSKTKSRAALEHWREQVFPQKHLRASITDFGI
jgi:hypothetical protein